MTGENKPFNKYLKIRQEVDKFTGKLEKMHRKHLACKKGCDSCCMDFSVLPVEFYYILNELQNKGLKPEIEEPKAGTSCTFLKNHACTIYENRPLICRTHGMPLIYANDDGEFELSACELNFKEFDFDDFNMENTFHQDKYNSKLFMLNREFLMNENTGMSELELIPVKNLVTQLNNPVT